MFIKVTGFRLPVPEAGVAGRDRVGTLRTIELINYFWIARNRRYANRLYFPILVDYMSAYLSYNDQYLFTLLKQSDVGAYTALFDRYQPMLYVYACKITRDEDEAADIVQEVFLNLWEKKGTIEISQSLLSYLYQSVRYRFFSALDKKKVREDYAVHLRKFMQEGELITDATIREREIFSMLDRLVDQLPEKLKVVYELSQKSNLTTPEIARQLQLSEKTVQNRLSLALKYLRIKMGLMLVCMTISQHIIFLLKKF